MTFDPAIEAAQRAVSNHMGDGNGGPTDIEIAAAREMAKPIRELVDHLLWSPPLELTGNLSFRRFVNDLRKLIYTETELTAVVITDFAYIPPKGQHQP